MFFKELYATMIYEDAKKQSKGKFWFTGDLVKNTIDSEEVSRDEERAFSGTKNS